MWAPFPGDTNSCSSALSGAAPLYHPYFIALGWQSAPRWLSRVISDEAVSVQQVVQRYSNLDA